MFCSRQNASSRFLLNASAQKKKSLRLLVTASAFTLKKSSLATACASKEKKCPSSSGLSRNKQVIGGSRERRPTFYLNILPAPSSPNQQRLLYGFTAEYSLVIRWHLYIGRRSLVPPLFLKAFFHDGQDALDADRNPHARRLSRS